MEKGEWILLKGDGMVTEWWLNGHWNVPAIPSTEWIVTERWLNGAFQFSRNGGVSFCLWCWILKTAPVRRYVYDVRGLQLNLI